MDVDEVTELALSLPDDTGPDTEDADDYGPEDMFPPIELTSPLVPPPVKSKRRSHTAPTPLLDATRASAGTSPQPTPADKSTLLRRSRTSAYSGKLEALEQAYAAVVAAAALEDSSDGEGDKSQIPVEELVHATRLVNKIGAALSEQMSRKLARGGFGGGGG